ncbi:MAG: hypothetical protein ACFE0J_06705 [Elainellaceae cyanobacterium]
MQNSLLFEGVREWNDAFLAFFPHRFDYIWAEHPQFGDAVKWRTETRHPLSDRLIQQGAYLYGVRFGAETHYCLLDIDAGSIYHPKHDSFAISRILAALEPLGLVGYVACTSSYSGGLHLYFPFQQAQSSWQLAIAVTCLLENAGFKAQPGHLEVFPNPKPYSADENPSLFNAHRLPLQAGSYLLNETWRPIWSSSQTFIRQWQLTQQHNDVDRKVLKHILKCAKRKHFGVSGKAEKFINDLNAEIELGWTSHGQTNRLLGRITMRAYIFHHVLSGGDPLEGEALVHEIVETAKALPGYRDWCRHQHEIEDRAVEWARCIENSHYFHFGDQRQKLQLESHSPELNVAVDQSPSWNQRQLAVTRDRIRGAIADLLEKDCLPARPTARFHALLKYGVGGASLYRHRDLWHPNHLDDHCDNYRDSSSTQDEADRVKVPTNNKSPVDPPPNPPTTKTDSRLDCVQSASNRLSPTSLFPSPGSNSISDNAFGDRPLMNASLNGSNIFPTVQSDGRVSENVQGLQYVKHALVDAQAERDARQEASRLAWQHHQRIKLEAAERRQIARMQQYLDSDDPILIAEAVAWAQVNPGVLQVNSRQMSMLADFSGEDSGIGKGAIAHRHGLSFKNGRVN